MAYTFSFNTLPPSGFSINAATGLITIAATASPFAGNLSVRVSDGISTDIKIIAVNLVAPIVTPLISSISRSIYSCGGRMGGGVVAVTPVLYQSGGEMQSAILEIGKNITVYETGKGQWISAIEEAQTPAAIQVTISEYDFGLEVGSSQVLTASVSLDYDTSGISQDVLWSIVPGPYSNYCTISTVGNECTVTAANGSWYYGDASVEIKATSVQYPSAIAVAIANPLTSFRNLQQIAPTSVSAGALISISYTVETLGQNVLPSDPDQPYFSTTIYEPGRGYSYIDGQSINYTAGTSAVTIEVTARYIKPFRGTVAQKSFTIQNTGPAPAPSGLTLVPSYTVANVGGTSWESLSWATLNDDNILTGAAIGDSFGFPSIVINLGSALLIKKIVLAGGDFSINFGDTVAPYLNGATIDYSTNDGASWTTYATVSGVVDTAGNAKEYFPQIAAKHWRLRRTQYVATTSFKFYT